MLNDAVPTGWHNPDQPVGDTIMWAESMLADATMRWGGKCLTGHEALAWAQAKAGIVMRCGQIARNGRKEDAQRILAAADALAATVTFEPAAAPQNPHACNALGCILALPGPRVGVGNCRCLEGLDHDPDRRVRVRNGIKWLREHATKGGK